MPSLISPTLDSAHSFALRPKSCQVCGTSRDLSACQDCRVVYFCSQHQATLNIRHQNSCPVIEKARGEVYRRKEYEDQRTPSLIRGRILGGTASAYFALARAMLVCFPFHRVSIEESLQILLATEGGLPPLHWSVEGIHSIIPTLYLRLGRDLAAYEYLEQGQVRINIEPDVVHFPRLEPIPRSLPASARTDATSFDISPIWTVHRNSLGDKVSQILLNIRLLNVMRNMQHATLALHPALPDEIIDKIRAYHLKGSVLAKYGNRTTLSFTKLAENIPKLKSHIIAQYTRVKANNPYLWSALLNPQVVFFRTGQDTIDSIEAIRGLEPFNDHTWRAKMQPPRGSELEAQAIVGFCYWAWQETPGALNFVSRAREWPW